MRNETTFKLVAAGINAGAWSVTMADINEILTALSLLSAIIASLAVAWFNFRRKK